MYESSQHNQSEQVHSQPFALGFRQSAVGLPVGVACENRTLHGRLTFSLNTQAACSPLPTEIHCHPEGISKSQGIRKRGLSASTRRKTPNSLLPPPPCFSKLRILCLKENQIIIVMKQTNIYKATQLTREPIWERHLPGSLLWKGFISVGVIAGGNISKCLAQLSSTSLAT